MCKKAVAAAFAENVALFSGAEILVNVRATFIDTPAFSARRAAVNSSDAREAVALSMVRCVDEVAIRGCQYVLLVARSRTETTEGEWERLFHGENALGIRFAASAEKSNFAFHRVSQSGFPCQRNWQAPT